MRSTVEKTMRGIVGETVALADIEIVVINIADAMRLVAVAIGIVVEAVTTMGVVVTQKSEVTAFAARSGRRHHDRLTDRLPPTSSRRWCVIIATEEEQ